MSLGLDLLPVLLTPDEAREGSFAHQPLFEGAPADALVVGLAEEGEPLTEERIEELDIELDEALTEALDALGGADDSAWVEQAVPVKGGGTLRILVRDGEDAASEEMLLPEVLAEAAKALRASALAVAAPVRGTLLVTDVEQKWQIVAAFATAVRMQHAAGGENALWPGVLRVEAGRITGVIELRTASLDAAAQRNGAG